MRKAICYFFFFCSFQIALGQTDTTQQEHLNIGNYFWDKSELYYPADFDSCIYYTQQSQVHFKKAKAWTQYVNCYNGLSTLYYNTGDFQQYVSYSNKAIEQALLHLGQNSRPYGYALNNLGSFYMRKGENNRAIQLYKNSIVIQEKADSLTSKLLIQLSKTYKNLGNAFLNKRDFLESLRYYEKSYSIKTSTKKRNISFMASNLYDIGNCYHLMNQQDSAILYFDKSLQLLDAHRQEEGDYSKQTRIHCYQGIAEALITNKELDKALNAIKSTITLQGAEKAYRRAYSTELKGRCFTSKSPAKAIKLFQNAIQLFVLNNPSILKNSNLARLHQQIAEVYFSQGKTQQALQSYQTALQKLAYEFASDDPADNPEIRHLLSQAEAIDILDGKAQCLIKLASEAASDHYRLQAHQCYQMAKSLIRNLRNDYLANGSKHILAGKVLPIYEHAISNALNLYQQSKDQSYLYDAFDSAEGNKALLLLEILNEKAAKHNSGIPDSLLAKENELTIDLAFYNRKIQEEKQKGDRAKKNKILQWEALHFDLQKDYQDLIATLEEKFPKYHSAKYESQLIDPKKIQQTLSKDALLLEYFVGEKKSYLFSLSKDQLRVRKIALDTTQQQAIQDFRQLVMHPPRHQSALEDFALFTKLGEQLYQQLLAPELSNFPNTTQLIIVPDPILALLPFELLLYEKNQTQEMDYAPDILPYLFGRYAISYDYSASIFMKNQGQSLGAADKSFAGFAPGFNTAVSMTERSCQGDALYSLQCSEEEIAGIQSLLGGKTYSGPNASKNHFATEAATYRILHLATHACVDDSNPMLNRIYFTDDYLSNYELSALQLNAELAVLSACNTGAGKLIQGEGVMSLARSFVEAGCPSIIMSLWPINDCSTSSIMQHFYQFLNKGLEKNEALRQAKLRFLENAAKAERHPYYWAAFVQFGKTSPLEIKGGMPYWWIGALSIIGLLIAFFTWGSFRK